MDSKKTSFGRELLNTVAGNNLINATIDVVEVMLDQNLADGVLKDLPIVGILAKLAQAKQSIFEELFLRKLVRFLSALKEVSVEDRAKLIEKYPDFSDEQRILGENLLLALERLDDIEKPLVLAQFFLACVKGEIDYITFTRLARSLEKFNMALLPNLRWYYTRNEPAVETPEEIIHELSLAGLVTVGLAGSGVIGGAAGYSYSSLGKFFLLFGFDIIFDDPSPTTTSTSEKS